MSASPAWFAASLSREDFLQSDAISRPLPTALRSSCPTLLA
jgi:hypothetical protein